MRHRVLCPASIRSPGCPSRTAQPGSYFGSNGSTTTERRSLVLRRKRYCFARSAEGLRQPRQDHEVSVKADALQTSNPERFEAIVVLQVSEQPLHGYAATVEALPLVRVT